MEKMLTWPLSSLQCCRGHCSWLHCLQLYCVCLFLLCQCKTLHLNVQHHGQKDNISYEILKNHIFIFRRGQNGTANSVNIGFVMTWPDVLFNIPTFYDIPNIISVMPWWFVSAAASDQKKRRKHVVAIYAWLCLSCANSGADTSNSGCVL